MRKKISLTWGDVQNEIFLGVVQSMINSRLSFPVTQKLLLLAKVVNNERSHFNVVHDKLIKEYSEVVKEEGKPDSRRLIEAKREEFRAKEVEALAHRFVTKIDQIGQEDLKDLKINVNELIAISPILVDGDLMREEAEEVDKHSKEEALPETKPLEGNA